MRSTAIAYPLEDLQGWESSLLAFLVKKERRSGSRRTVEDYTYRGKGGKTGDRELPQPAVDALGGALAAFGRELEDIGVAAEAHRRLSERYRWPGCLDRRTSPVGEKRGAATRRWDALCCRR